MRELNYAPRLVCALLAGVNGIISNIVLVKCNSNYPEFLRWSYYLILTIVIATGYTLLLYLSVAVVKVFLIGGNSAMQHHEMEDEDDYKDSKRIEGGPIHGHLKEQKTMKN